MSEEQPVVEIRGLWTVFRTPAAEFVIHRDLDLTIARGEVVSLVGGSGTGKTTLLRQILGLETPTRGTIRILGQPVARLGETGASSRVGMLFQHGALFSAFTALENIAFPLHELKTLPEALIRDIALVKLQMVGVCHLCGDCQINCPEHIAVTDMVRYHSYVHQYNEKELARSLYRQAGYDPARLCSNCGKCEDACKSGVPITDILHQLSIDMG